MWNKNGKFVCIFVCGEETNARESAVEQKKKPQKHKIITA